MNRFHSFLTIILVLATTSAAAQQKLPTIPLTAGMYVIQAEVAARDADRQQGLMFRERMGPNEGMVFLFERPAAFWIAPRNARAGLQAAE